MTNEKSRGLTSKQTAGCGVGGEAAKVSGLFLHVAYPGLKFTFPSKRKLHVLSMH